MSPRALIVVDIQVDFMPGGALAVAEGDRVIPLINALQGQFDLVRCEPRRKSFSEGRRS